MQDTYRIADETFVLPSTLPIPGFGLLYMNAMVLRGAQPILVDTGAPICREEYFEAAVSLVDPEDVRWIFLSHDDRDHSGNLIQALERCPNARLISNFVGVGRMSEEWAVPRNRVHLLNDGESLDVGDRTLTAIRPPFYDSPATRGLWDSRTRVYYGVDSFGAPVPHPCEEVSDVAVDVYENGFNWFNRVNHPWHEVSDPRKIDAQIARIRELSPEVIISYHGPRRATGATSSATCSPPSPPWTGWCCPPSRTSRRCWRRTRARPVAMGPPDAGAPRVDQAVPVG